MAKRDKVAPATTPEAAAPAVTPAAAPAAAVTPPVSTGGRIHTKADLEAAVAAGRAKGPLNAGGQVERLPGYQRLLREHPEDAGADVFLRDSAGNIVLFDLECEKGKKAVLRRSAGASRAWIVVRTSDLFQTRFWDGERPKGSKKSSKALPAAAGIDLAAI